MIDVLIRNCSPTQKVQSFFTASLSERKMDDAFCFAREVILKVFFLLLHLFTLSVSGSKSFKDNLEPGRVDKSSRLAQSKPKDSIQFKSIQTTLLIPKRVIHS